MSLSVVILAGGEGKRMRSQLAKVLHPLAGKPLLAHVIETALSLHPTEIFVVYGRQGGQLKAALPEAPVKWVEQAQALGTGHAVRQVLPYLKENQQLLVLFGDMPLIQKETLSHLVQMTPPKGLGWLTAGVENPTGFGRIIRDAKGNVQAIIEEKDASAAQKQIKEVNTGTCLFPSDFLKTFLPQLKNHNVQGEYYLTDLLSIASQQALSIVTTQPSADVEMLGANDKVQLADAERAFQKRQAIQLMQQGVTLMDPERFDLRGTCEIGSDVVIDVNVVMEGHNVIGSKCYIGSNVLLKNAVIGDGVKVHANSIIESSTIANECEVGPFARLRPESHLKKYAKVGNFVEIKKSIIGEGSKVNHLSYIGDATIGKRVNIGAGTITCNYDGANKHKTEIGDDAFIGSDTQLVSPVKVGIGATIGAGTTLISDAPAGKLTLSRAKQVTIEAWQRPLKKQKEKKE